tara:strand:- start:2762 stop:2998 length:237 start_codon:yes stop_codon:yes gene_type:complete
MLQEVARIAVSALLVVCIPVYAIMLVLNDITSRAWRVGRAAPPLLRHARTRSPQRSQRVKCRGADKARVVRPNVIEAH